MDLFRVKHLYLLLFITFLTECKKDFASPQVKQAYEEVMRIHDEVMPETETIHKLQKRLKKEHSGKEDAKELINRLERSDDGMMEWMGDFKLDRSAPVTEQIEYLTRENTRISKVSKDMRSSIDEAKAYLSSK